jgi:hypothetical protein
MHLTEQEISNSTWQPELCIDPLHAMCTVIIESQPTSREHHKITELHVHAANEALHVKRTADGQCLAVNIDTMKLLQCIH